MSRRYPAHHFVKTGPIVRCQVCNAQKLHLILDLGHQPLCDTLLSPDRLQQPEMTYPLKMMWCATCSCVQLDYCVDGKVVFHPGYPYRSGISKPLADYQFAIAESLISKYTLQPSDLVVDVGSNDGTLLSGFQARGLRVLGVEPTNIARLANRAGVKTLQKFFDIQLAKNIRAKYGKARLITATNVFAHMQTVGEVIVGIYDLLEDDGVFVSETHYLLDVLRDGQFDTVYHEHLRTYSLKSLIKLFAYYDFTLTDVERGSRYGGNLRVHVTKGKGRKVSPRVAALLKAEKAAGVYKLETYQKFAKRAQAGRLEVVDFLMRMKTQRKSVVGKSCPGRASTLLNYYGVGPDLLPYLAEQSTSLKLGLYLPGQHIPVVDEKRLFKEQPDYVMLMAWHYADVIMKRLKVQGLQSDFVVPLPKLKIIKNSQVKV